MFERDLYRALAQNLPGFGIFLFDDSFRFISSIGDEILNSFGLLSEDVVGKTLHEIDFPTDSSVIENYFLEALRGNSSEVEIERTGTVLLLRFAPVRSINGDVTAGLLTCHDLTEVVKSRETLRNLSVTDELTGIYNRRGFTLLVNQSIKVLDRTKNGGILFFIDLNDLKIINDTIGHKEGDEVLKAASMVLQNTFRDSDIIARHGGDEFVVFTTDVQSDMESTFRSRLREAISSYNSKKRPFRLSMSVGSSYYDPECPSTLDELVAAADESMYRQKNHRRAHGSSGSLPKI